MNFSSILSYLSTRSYKENYLSTAIVFRQELVVEIYQAILKIKIRRIAVSLTIGATGCGNRRRDQQDSSNQRSTHSWPRGAHLFPTGAHAYSCPRGAYHARRDRFSDFRPRDLAIARRREWNKRIREPRDNRDDDCSPLASLAHTEIHHGRQSCRFSRVPRRIVT